MDYLEQQQKKFELAMQDKKAKEALKNNRRHIKHTPRPISGTRAQPLELSV